LIKLVPAIGDPPFGNLADWKSPKGFPKAFIAKTAGIFGNAWVSDEAQVCNKARIYNSGKVFEAAKLMGNAYISGVAKIFGNAQVCGNAKVYDGAQVSGSAEVYDNARVSGDARVSGNALIFGDARVYDDARVSGEARISGNALISGFAVIEFTSDYLCIGPVGQADNFLTMHYDSSLGIRINRGCFSHNLKSFLKRLKRIPQHAFYKKHVPSLCRSLRERILLARKNDKVALARAKEIFAKRENQFPAVKR
jgi:carbonic anhydrase/acetyltransferase-like protein (isoleucine patch superfamily)